MWAASLYRWIAMRQAPQARRLTLQRILLRPRHDVIYDMARAADVVLPRCIARDTLRACSASLLSLEGAARVRSSAKPITALTMPCCRRRARSSRTRRARPRRARGWPSASGCARSARACAASAARWPGAWRACSRRAAGAPAPAVTAPPEAGLCGRGRLQLQLAACRPARPAGNRQASGAGL